MKSTSRILVEIIVKTIWLFRPHKQFCSISTTGLPRQIWAGQGPIFYPKIFWPVFSYRTKPWLPWRPWRPWTMKLGNIDCYTVLLLVRTYVEIQTFWCTVVCQCTGIPEKNQIVSTLMACPSTWSIWVSFFYVPKKYPNRIREKIQTPWTIQLVFVKKTKHLELSDTSGT